MTRRGSVEDRYGRLAIHASDWLQPVINELLDDPLVPQRRRALRQRFDVELRRRADSHGTSVEYELLQAARIALSLALPLSVPDCLMDANDSSAADYARRELRRRINERVTHDLLGHEWRHEYAQKHDTVEDHEHELEASDPLIDLLTAQTNDEDLLATLVEADLTPSERALVDVIANGEADTRAEAARRLGITPANARKIAERIRRKTRR